MKIYTKTGDKGTTSLFGGMRVGKDSARINAVGSVDELNATIGVIVADLGVILSKAKDLDSSPALRDQNDKHKNIVDKLLRIQSELFVLGADLATPMDVRVKVPRVNKPMITKLEKEVDELDKDLPKLKNFILPGGSEVGARLHLARTITRRVERFIAILAKNERINLRSQIYINRLSDWFFVLARYVNKIEGVGETIWKGRGMSPKVKARP